MSRGDGRSNGDPRSVGIETGVQHFPAGSVRYAAGGTAVLIAASVEESVRDFLRGTGRGWVTAEYAMHPCANPNRQKRERTRGQVDGRSQEIQRLIGRALRAAVVPAKIGERTLTVDCDVLDADGGTRTASITGGFVAMAMALERLRRQGLVGNGVLRDQVAAVSAALVDGQVMVDPAYEEDSRAEVDLNVVATASGNLVEVQGTAEGAAIPRDKFDALVDAALAALPALFAAQRAALEAANVELTRLLVK